MRKREPVCVCVCVCACVCVCVFVGAHYSFLNSYVEVTDSEILACARHIIVFKLLPTVAGWLDRLVSAQLLKREGAQKASVQVK